METNDIKIDAFNSVNYLFARPAYQGHYYYAIDDINTNQIIDKDSLRQLLVRLQCRNFIRLNYLMDRNFPFFYDVKNKELQEFEETNSDITREDLRNYIHEELNVNMNQQNNQSNYERFFGNNSDFYKNNIYDFINKENELWQ